MRKGIPVSARLPMIMEVEVRGIVLNRLWIMDPEHIKSMALKKAWVQMCRNAKYGWLMPMVIIIRPSWLEVEKATIFLMSFCVRAQMAVNRVVIAPRHNVRF